jgi:hypothetical protein
MGREDWAWLMACAVCGLIVSSFTLVPLVLYQNQAHHYGTKYTFTTSDDDKSTSQSVEQYEVPVYTEEITIRLNGATDEIIRAISSLKRKDLDVNISHIDEPPITVSDCLQTTFGAIFLFVIVTFIFRFVETICLRILGLRQPTEEIVRGLSTATGQARLAQDDKL